MKLGRIANGGVPFLPLVTVFSATAIVEGAMLVTGASTTAQGAVILVALDTSDFTSTIGVTQVGSSQASSSVENRAPNSHAFRIPSSGFPVTGTASTAGLCYLPLCINPDAMYMVQYSTTTGSGTASDNVATWTASTITAVARGTTGTDVLGGYLFSLSGVNSAGNTPTFSGSLRYIANQAATTSVTLLTAMNVSTDSHMIWVDRTWKNSGVFNATADKFRSQSGSTGTGFQLNGTRMIRIENYMNADNLPTHPLRSWVDDGRNGLTGVEMYSETIFTTPLLQAIA